jgi:hypothetical protein
MANGMKGYLSCQLYNEAAIPAMLYRASVWLTPINKSSAMGMKSRGSVGVVSKLSRVQRTAAIHITEALQTTANYMLNAHTDLLPMELLINKHCCREALHLTTIPPSYFTHTTSPHPAPKQ